MTDRVALVTGAGRGMGRAMALGLLAEGYSVAAVDRDGPPLAELATLAKGKPGRLLTLEVDLSQSDAVERIGRDVESAFVKIDILINNAGVGQGSIRPDNWQRPIRFWEVDRTQWERFLLINATVPFLLSRLVVSGMLARRWGRIIYVTTSLGTMLKGGFTPYGQTKACAEAQIGVFAEDLAGTGVTANVLVPGGVTNTDFVPEEAGFERSALLQPDIMAKPLIWLVSDAANHVTGRRFLAAAWDTALPGEEAAARAGASVGWRDIAVQPILPKSVDVLGSLRS